MSAKRVKSIKRVSWGDQVEPPAKESSGKYGGWGLTITKIIPNLDELRALYDWQPFSASFNQNVSVSSVPGSPTGAMVQIAQEKKRWEKQRKSSQIETLKQKSQSQPWRIPKTLEIPETIQKVQNQALSTANLFENTTETIDIPRVPVQQQKPVSEVKDYDPMGGYDPAMAMDDASEIKRSRWSQNEPADNGKKRSQSRWETEEKKSRWSEPSSQVSGLGPARSVSPINNAKSPQPVQLARQDNTSPPVLMPDGVNGSQSHNIPMQAQQQGTSNEYNGQALWKHPGVPQASNPRRWDQSSSMPQPQPQNTVPSMPRSRPSRFDQQLPQSSTGTTFAPQPYQGMSNGNGQFGANSQFTHTNAPFQRDNSPVPPFAHTSVVGGYAQQPPQPIQHRPTMQQQRPIMQQQQHPPQQLSNNAPQHMVKVAIDQTHYQPSAMQPRYVSPFPPQQQGGRPY